MTDNMNEVNISIWLPPSHWKESIAYIIYIILEVMSTENIENRINMLNRENIQALKNTNSDASKIY